MTDSMHMYVYCSILTVMYIVLQNDLSIALLWTYVYCSANSQVPLHLLHYTLIGNKNKLWLT